MKRLYIAASAVLGCIIFASPASSQIPIIQGGIFGRVGGTFTTGDAPFKDAAGAFTVGTKQPLAWATTAEGFEYPASLGLVALSTTPIGADGVSSGNDVTSLDLGIETHIWLGLNDIRLSLGAGGSQELSDPSGPENGNIGLMVGLVHNLTWNPDTKSGFVVDLAYATFKRNTRPYAAVNLTLTFFLPKS